MAFRFRLEIDGISVAQVSEVNGLSLETEIEPYEEGGINDFVYQLPKKTKFQPLTLRRGITPDEDLWEWYKEVRFGKFKRKNGAIVLIDASGKDTWRWNFIDAYPVKWAGPDFKAESNTIAFEAVTIAHHGIWKE